MTRGPRLLAVRRFLRRAGAMAHKEVLHMIRDVRVLYLALGLPVLMLLVFGYAVSMDIDHIRLAVVDDDHTQASRALVEAFAAGGQFVRVKDAASAEDAETLVRRGDAKAVLLVPRGYERDLARGESRGAELLLDGSDGTVATLALGDAAGIAASMGAAERASLAEGPRVRARFNPGMRSANDIVPGVIALILAIVSSLLTALTVAGEWERGSMEQLFATPVGRAEIILGKLLPHAGLGFVQALLVLTLGSYLFDVPIRGSLVLLFFASLLFLVAMLGFGLFVSVITKSQQVSVQAALLGSMLPSTLLSGFLFPIANMPPFLRAVARIVPARYYITALRGILLKGNDAWTLLPGLLALAAFAFLMLSSAVGRFRRTLD